MSRELNKCFVMYWIAMFTALISVGAAIGLTAGHQVVRHYSVLEYSAPDIHTMDMSFTDDVITKAVEEILEQAEQEKEEEIADEPLISDEELDLFARCVQAEAGNQGLTGKCLVADVVLNRVDSWKFPDTITEVILQHTGDYYQFSVVQDGAIDRAEPDEETYLAIQMELESRSCPGLMYFAADDYLPYGTPWKKIGDHYFSTD